MKHPNVIVWTQAVYDRFKKAYSEAVDNKVERFTFDNHEFLTTYAGYLVKNHDRFTKLKHTYDNRRSRKKI